MSSVVKPICKLGIDVRFCRVKKSRTAKTEQLMQWEYKLENKALKAEDRTLTFIDLFNDAKEEVVRFHFIFCLDESGSMDGPLKGEALKLDSPWAALLNGFRSGSLRSTRGPSKDPHELHPIPLVHERRLRGRQSDTNNPVVPERI